MSKNKFDYCRLKCPCHNIKQLCNSCILHNCYLPFKGGVDRI